MAARRLADKEATRALTNTLERRPLGWPTFVCRAARRPLGGELKFSAHSSAAALLPLLILSPLWATFGRLLGAFGLPFRAFRAPPTRRPAADKIGLPAGPRHSPSPQIGAQRPALDGRPATGRRLSAARRVQLAHSSSPRPARRPAVRSATGWRVSAGSSWKDQAGKAAQSCTLRPRAPADCLRPLLAGRHLF